MADFTETEGAEDLFYELETLLEEYSTVPPDMKIKILEMLIADIEHESN
jgi:hypothetical protein